MALRSIKSSQRHIRENFFRLVHSSLTGTLARNAALGKYDCTCKVDATGIYTIELDKAYGLYPVVTASVLHATLKLYHKITSVDTNTIVIAVFDEGGTARAADELHVHVAGSDLGAEG